MLGGCLLLFGVGVWCLLLFVCLVVFVLFGVYCLLSVACDV